MIELTIDGDLISTIAKSQGINIGADREAVLSFISQRAKVSAFDDDREKSQGAALDVLECIQSFHLDWPPDPGDS